MITIRVEFRRESAGGQSETRDVTVEQIPAEDVGPALHLIAENFAFPAEAEAVQGDSEERGYARFLSEEVRRVLSNPPRAVKAMSEELAFDFPKEKSEEESYDRNLEILKRIAAETARLSRPTKKSGFPLHFEVEWEKPSYFSVDSLPPGSKLKTVDGSELIKSQCTSGANFFGTKFTQWWCYNEGNEALGLWLPRCPGERVLPL